MRENRVTATKSKRRDLDVSDNVLKF